MSQLSNAVFHISFRLLQTKNHNLEEKKCEKNHPDEPFDMRVSIFGPKVKINVGSRGVEYSNRP